MATKKSQNQASLFSSVEMLDLPNSSIPIHRNLIDSNEAEDHFIALLSEVHWSQEQIQMFGKATNIPRLTAWYGDEDKPYTYSGIEMSPLPWTPRLQTIKTLVESVAEETFNSVLLNYYRNGSDSVAWHADNEPELGLTPTIGSVSLGAPRAFQFRNVTDCKEDEITLEVELRNGDVLIMGGDTQKYWNHQIPKRANAKARINLTFRRILS